MSTTVQNRARQRRSEDEIARLVQAAARGSQTAWNDIVTEFEGMMWAVTRAHRLSDTDCADVVQSTWLRLLERLGDIKDPGRVGAWLATTARRECLRVLRNARREVLCGDASDEQESAGETLDAALLSAERNDALWRCFGRLRESDQALLRLLMADPRPTYQEISAGTGMPVGAIGPTRARALDRLRRELDHQGALALLIA